MINNYFKQSARPPIQITYTPRINTPLRPQPTPYQRKYKLIIALLVRAANRVLKEGVNAIQHISRRKSQALTRIVAIA